MEEPRREPEDAGPSRGRTAFLARRAQSGDLTEFEELYARLAPALYAWAAMRAPPGVDAGDVLGEVWLRALERLHTHDGENHEFRAWIFGIAKNVMLQLLRARRGESLSSPLAGGASTYGTNGADRLPDSVTSISQKLAREDSVRHLIEFANRLEPVDRDLFIHCGLEGLPCAEAATRIGVGDEAAAKRWQRLRAGLREKSWVRDLLLEAG